MAGKALLGLATVAVAMAMAMAMALAACGGDEPTTYTPEVQENFVNSCVDSATSGTAPADESDAEQLCGCMYNELKARMSFEEFKTADQSLREGEQMSSDLAATLQAAAGACTKAADRAKRGRSLLSCLTDGSSARAGRSGSQNVKKR